MDALVFISFVDVSSCLGVRVEPSLLQRLRRASGCCSSSSSLAVRFFPACDGGGRFAGSLWAALRPVPAAVVLAFAREDGGAACVILVLVAAVRRFVESALGGGGRVGSRSLASVSRSYKWQQVKFFADDVVIAAFEDGMDGWMVLNCWSVNKIRSDVAS